MRERSETVFPVPVGISRMTVPFKNELEKELFLEFGYSCIKSFFQFRHVLILLLVHSWVGEKDTQAINVEPSDVFKKLLKRK